MLEPDSNVSFANQLVREVRESANLVLKQLACCTGYSTSAIGRYELGEVPVPVDYVARLFAETRDLRLVQLVWPALTIHMIQRDPPPAARHPANGRPATLHDLTTLEMGVLDQLAEALLAVHQIGADGKVDSDDDPRILRLQQCHNMIAMVIGQVNAEILARRQAAEVKERR